MRNRTVSLAILLSLTLYANATSSPTPKQSLTLYRSQLSAKCPDKHLEMLSPAALSDLDDAFLPRFSPTQRRIVQASIDRSCRGIDMGATCGNIGFLQATIRLHKLDAFTSRVCAQQQRCTDYSMCSDTK